MRLALATLALAACAMAQGNLPQLPGDWQGIVIDSILINQGGEVVDGLHCCDPTAPECKIQSAYQAAKQYYSVKNNAIRNQNPDGSAVITLFAANISKEFLVDQNNNCQAYCPLPREEQGDLTPLGYGQNATNEGTVKSGQYAGLDEIYWRIVIPIVNITMEVDYFYVNTSGSIPVPVAQIADIEPAGENLGLENTTFAGVVAGTQPASLFEVKGMASCPMSNQCQGDDDAPSDDMPVTMARRIPGTFRFSKLVGAALTSFPSSHAALEAFGLASEPLPAKPTLKIEQSAEELYAKLPKEARVDFPTFRRILSAHTA